MDPPKLANTTLDVTIPLAEVDEAVRNVRRLLAELRYRGVFNIEFKQDERDGTFRIIEVNARPYWLIAHTATAGMDLPWLAYLDAQGLPLPPMEQQVGRYGMYEVPEISALIRAWVRGRRPEGPIVAPWLRGDHTLLWASDPLPGVFDLSRATRRRFGEALGRAATAVRRAAAHPRVSPGRGAT
jgi:predicted ATP-grasp superfamily ATP-dependent carboligase